MGLFWTTPKWQTAQMAKRREKDRDYSAAILMIVFGLLMGALVAGLFS